MFHPTIVYIKNADGKDYAVVTTQLAFTPELQTTIYHNGVKAVVTLVIVDISPKIPAIVIHAQIK